jgi:hypothetical protein
MRTLKFVTLLALVLLVAALGWGKVPKSTIAGSHHDLRVGPDTDPDPNVTTPQWTGASFTLCSFCHIAHKPGATPTGPGDLLWNHELSTVASYGVYSNTWTGTFDGSATIADVGTSGGTTASSLCLSCHDGTVAVNNWYEPVTSSTFAPISETPAYFIPAGAVIRDLTKTHPVNFVYDAALATADGGLATPNSTLFVDDSEEVPLFNGRMECATCHDPHNGNSGIFTRDFPAQPSGSFCTFCHL